MLQGEPTAAPLPTPVADVIAIAKRDLAAGETLDGIGGATVRGVVETRETARREGTLPLGLAERVKVREAVPYDDRVRKFEFQVREGAGWRTLFAGERLGARFEKRFGPVTAREFRLSILDAIEGPTISEIELIDG